MKRSLLSVIIAMQMAVPFAFSQSATQPSEPSGLALLQRVGQKYSNAKSYRISWTEEEVSTRELSRNWNKKILAAAGDSEHRYRFEATSNMGGAARISDGRRVWTYHPEQHKYTAKPVGEKVSAGSRPIAYVEMPLYVMDSLRENLGKIAEHYRSATRLNDEPLEHDGRKTDSYVVRVTSADQKRIKPDYTFEKTIWIDKASFTILKIEESAQTVILADTRVPMHIERTEVYETQLDTDFPADFFTFSPPPDARLASDFPDISKHSGGADLTGEKIPALKLVSADGKAVSLDSFRGKPVLLDLWATWCPPCVKGLAQLSQLYADAKGTDLVLISIDQDEEARTATDFLAKNNYQWPNYHDGDAQIARRLGASGVPRAILIDAQGIVVYDETTSSDDDLRSAVVKLGNEYALLAPRPKRPANPCVALK